MMWRRQKSASDEATALPPEPLRGFDDYDLRLGDLMRGERATLGKSLLDVQRDLKIAAEHIVAIENGDLSPFDVPSFVAGYVRSYARYLGMDAEWAYARFCEELGFSVTHGLAPEASVRRRARAEAEAKGTYIDAAIATPSVPFVPQREGLLPRIDPGALGSVMVLVVLIGAIGYGGWSVLREVQQVQLAPVEQPPQVVVDIDPLGNVGLAEPPPAGAAAANGAEEGTTTAAAALERFYRPEALDVPVLTPRDGPIAAIVPPRPETMVPESPSVAATGLIPSDPSVTRPAASDPAQAVAGAAPTEAEADPVARAVAEASVRVLAEPPPEVEIMAVQPAWVRVRAADGTVLFEKILDAGERYRVPPSEAPATLRAGNSGAVFFLVNGVAYGPAATSSQVVRNVELSALALSERYGQADLNGNPPLARYVAELGRTGQQ